MGNILEMKDEDSMREGELSRQEILDSAIERARLVVEKARVERPESISLQDGLKAINILQEHSRKSARQIKGDRFFFDHISFLAGESGEIPSDKADEIRKICKAILENSSIGKGSSDLKNYRQVEK